MNPNIIPRMKLKNCAAFLVLAFAPALIPARDLGVLPCRDLAQLRTVVRLDEKESQDRNGSIRISATQNAVITVADKEGFSVGEGNTFWCAVKLKGTGIEGRAYLEMWCETNNKNRAFSKLPLQNLNGEFAWREVRVPMMVNYPVKIERAKLNVVILGTGTLRVESVRVSSVTVLTPTPRPVD